MIHVENGIGIGFPPCRTLDTVDCRCTSDLGVDLGPRPPEAPEFGSID